MKKELSWLTWYTNEVLMQSEGQMNHGTGISEALQ